jgi:hypothetical protein
LQESRLKQELVVLAEEVRKSKEAAQLAENRMKQYEKS